MKKKLFTIIFIAGIIAYANAQITTSTENPLNAEFVYKDVLNFINAFNTLDEVHFYLDY